MRTVKEREKLDARFSRASRATRWLYKHHLIPKVVKVTIQDFIDDRWSESYNQQREGFIPSFFYVISFKLYDLFIVQSIMKGNGHHERRFK